KPRNIQLIRLPGGDAAVREEGHREGSPRWQGALILAYRRVQVDRSRLTAHSAAFHPDCAVRGEGDGPHRGDHRFEPHLLHELGGIAGYDAALQSYLHALALILDCKPLG